MEETLTRTAMRDHRAPGAPRLRAAIGALASYFLIQLIVGVLVVIGMLLAALMSGHAHPTAILRAPHAKPLLAMILLPVSCTASVLLFRAWFRRQWSLPGLSGLGLNRLPAGIFTLHLVLGLGLAVIGSMLTLLLTHGRPATQDIARLLLQAPLSIRLAIAAMTVLVVPVAEEILFRGILLPALMRHASLGIAIALDASIFALVHLPDLAWKPQGLLALALVGAVCCWRRVKTGSLYSAMAVHAGNNLLAVLVLVAHH